MRRALLITSLLLASASCDPLDAGEVRAVDFDRVPVFDSGLDAGTDADLTNADRPDRGAADQGRPTADRGAPLDLGFMPDQDVDQAIGGAGGMDARVPPDADVDPPPLNDGPARYLSGSFHSPLTPSVRDGLRAIAALGPGLADDVFAKIGDSLTVSAAFMHCFGRADDAIRLDGRDQLWDTITHFRGGRAGNTNPFRRESVAATVGWSASSAYTGNPSPIDTELRALDPRFAVVMFGSNDIQRRNIDSYAEQMFDIADQLIGEGVIPIFSSVPPRGDDRDADFQVPPYNAVVRGIAQGLQVPFVDLELALRPIDDFGLAGDNLHGSTYRQDGTLLPCAFTAPALQDGYNWRNLLTIEALHRMVDVVLGDAAPPDAVAPALEGQGTVESPYVVDTFPFTHLGDTSVVAQRAFDSYPGCDAPQNQGGPEVLYRLDIEEPVTLRAYVFDRGGVDIDLHMLGALDPDSCLERHDSSFAASLDPGTWYFSLDTFIGRDAVEDAGEYLFVIVADP
ncbi:MAG: hypothetical protein ACI9U2_003025 [Bradymonadia bacterium]|jgi:hypothetical protein